MKRSVSKIHVASGRPPRHHPLRRVNWRGPGLVERARPCGQVQPKSAESGHRLANSGERWRKSPSIRPNSTQNCRALPKFGNFSQCWPKSEGFRPKLTKFIFRSQFGSCHSWHLMWPQLGWALHAKQASLSPGSVVHLSLRAKAALGPPRLVRSICHRAREVAYFGSGRKGMQAPGLDYWTAFGVISFASFFFSATGLASVAGGSSAWVQPAVAQRSLAKHCRRQLVLPLPRVAISTI